MHSSCMVMHAHLKQCMRMHGRPLSDVVSNKIIIMYSIENMVQALSSNIRFHDLKFYILIVLSSLCGLKGCFQYFFRLYLTFQVNK